MALAATILLTCILTRGNSPTRRAESRTASPAGSTMRATSTTCCPTGRRALTMTGGGGSNGCRTRPGTFWRLQREAIRPANKYGVGYGGDIFELRKVAVG